MFYRSALFVVCALRRAVFALFVPVLAITLLFTLSARGQNVARRTLQGHVPGLVRNQAPIGRFAVTNRLNLAIGLPLRNQVELSEFLRQLYDPTSTNFHKYLTPEEFTDRFGPTAEDYEAVRHFAETNGMKVTATISSRLVLDVEGSVNDVERAFQITMQMYHHSTEGRDFAAPDREPSVPLNLSVADIGGLGDFCRPHSLLRHNKASVPTKQLSGTAPGGYFGGGDFRNAYAPGVALNGAGQKVGLLQFDGYNGRDITNYENDMGLTNRVPLTNVLIDSFSGGAGSGNDEVCLDIEMAMSMAPNLTQIILYEGNPGRHSFNPADVVARMANDNLAKNLSSSWTWSGGPEVTIDNSFVQMATQGQTYFQAAGDDDAYTGTQPLDNAGQVNSPVGDTNVTTVGGTTLTMNGTGLSYSNEVVWNDNATISNQGTGGGVSTVFAIPPWQAGLDMSKNLGSTTMRNTPDLACVANQVFIVFTQGGSSLASHGAGTSCAAPLMAGFNALVNQQNALGGRPSIGFLNPAIYAIGTSTNYTNCFHDTTVGNNIGSGTAGLYPATNGYDLCTGWGTPNGINLINALAPHPYIAQAPTNLTGTVGSNVTLSVAAGGQPPFTYRWLLSNTNLVGGGTISGTTSNVLSFTPISMSNAGNYRVVVSNSFGSVTSTVATVTVVNPNNPPVLSPISNQTINEQTTLQFTCAASDPDGNSLTFSLDPGAPAGASINSSTGVFSWTPTEAQGPSTNTITVRVTDNGVPPMSATQTFTVTVNEVNQPPVLQPIANKSDAAGTTLTFTASASDPDIPANTLSFSLDPGAPAGAGINSSSGLFSWMPTQGQAPSTNTITVRVTDNGVPSLSATQSFTVTVSQSNVPPVLTPVGNQTIYASNTLTITNMASDANVPAQQLTFSLDPGAPAGAAVTSGTGVFTWTPTAGQSPSTNSITVRVTDSGSPPLSAAQSFTVTVLQSNLPPVLAPIPDQTNFELTTLTITNMASDPNTPAQTLTFSLDSGAPTNAAIDPTNGVFTWTPTQEQSPGTTLITVRVTDSGVPPMSAAQSFTVTVLQTNLPPVLAPISNQTIHVGMTLVITNSATDPDSNMLAFSLDAGAPGNASIDPASGIFMWTPDSSFANTTNDITVRVTDDGVPPFSDAQSFVVTVVPLNFQTTTLSNDVLTISWGSISGLTYRVQYKTNLLDGSWTDLVPDVTATGPASSTTDSIDTDAQRFYRVLVVP